MMDKWERIQNLLKRKYEGKDGPAVSEEAIEDTLLDLSIYCKLEIILLKEWKETQT